MAEVIINSYVWSLEHSQTYCEKNCSKIYFDVFQNLDTSTKKLLRISIL